MENKSFMQKLAAGIVKSRVPIIILFLAVMVMTVFSIGWVNVEEDIAYYLPESAESKAGMLICNEEFFMYGSVNIMVKNITDSRAMLIADDIAEHNGVKSVQFDLTPDHYNNNCALYNVTFEYPSTDSENCSRITNELKSFLSNRDAYFYSEDIDMTDTLAVEMAKVLIWVVITVVVVLLFTSQTYGEIIVLVLTFVAAALVNMSTNFILGTMSFISYIVAVVLQLALSVDYAIIFCNRYKEEHALLPIKEAVVSALSKSIPEIASSSLTTIAGLAAMCFMQFKLGYDMGISLIKAIVCSLLTVFLFMPGLLVVFGKFMDRTHHKSFIPRIDFVGKLAYKTRFIIPPIFVIIVIIAYLGFSNVDFAYTMTLVENSHKNEADIALEEMQKVFGDDNMTVIVFPADDYEKELAFCKELDECDEVNRILGLAYIDAIDGYKLAESINYKQLMEIADIDEITAKALFAYYASGNNNRDDLSEKMEEYSVPLINLFITMHDVAETGSVELSEEQKAMIDNLYAQLTDGQKQLETDKYHRILIYLDLPQQGEETFAFFDMIHVIASQYWDDDEVFLTGNSASAYDFTKTFKNDNTIVSILSLVLVMIILMFTFKSLGMPLLLVLVIQGSIWLNFAFEAWTHNYVFFMVMLIVTSIQMGANIDYAIVISSRFKEIRAQGVEPRTAIIETINFSFPTVITSGAMMVMAGFLVSGGVSNVIIGGMGKHVGIGTSISLIFVNFALPQILILGEGFANSTSIKLPAGIVKGFSNKALRRSLIAGLLVVASAFALICAPTALSTVNNQADRIINKDTELVSTAEDLYDTATELSISQEKYNSTRMSYAEAVLTDEIGSTQLEEGAAQIAEGQELLDDNKALWESGNAQYQDALAMYQNGQSQINAAKQQLADGQAQYDDGQAQLNAAKQEYNSAKAALDAITPAYNLAMSNYNKYLADKAEYDAAVASGDEDKISELKVKVSLAQAAYESAGLGGKSFSQVIAEYDSAKAQLADGEAQISAAEAELAAAKAQLDEGYAQLEKGEKELQSGQAQLAAAKAQLDDGAAQIKDGEEQLNQAKEQLAEGEETLAENREKLMDDLNSLDKYADDEERLKVGVSILLEDADVSSMTTARSTYAEICAAAIRSFSNQIYEAERSVETARWCVLIIVVSAVFAVVSVLIWVFMGSPLYAAVLSVWAALGACLGAGLWKINCSGYTSLPYIACILLAIVSVLCTDSMIKNHRGMVAKRAAAKTVN